MLVVPAMTRLLISAHPARENRMQYYQACAASFPSSAIDLVDHHSRVDPYHRLGDILLTSGAHMPITSWKRGKSQVIRRSDRRVDGLGRPLSARASSSPHARAARGFGARGGDHADVALARDLPRAMRTGARASGSAIPRKLLKGKTVGIFGVGAIARSLAPSASPSA